MLKNYFKIALRNLLKNKLFSFITIFGLSLGIAASLILFLYVKSESGYDQFHEQAASIFRVRCDNLSDGKYTERMAVTNGPVAKTIKDLFPEVEEVVQVNKDNLDGMLSTDKFKFRLKNSFFASDAFFRVFSYKLIKGNPNTCLSELYSVVLSESMARKFYGDEDALGKIIKFNDHWNFKVTGVFKDTPSNSHLKFGLLVSYCTMLKYSPYMETEWDAAETNYTYLKLKPGVNPKQLESKFPEMVTAKIGSYLKGKNHDKRYFLQPITDIHLTSHYDSEIEANGDGTALKFFLIIAFLIMVIAWINYVNLSIAGSIQRYKEIGIRMVTGGSKAQIRKQFILEAIVLNGIAILFGVLLARFAYPYFSEFTGMQIFEDVWNDRIIWIGFIALSIAGALLSSIYPAFALTSFNPVQVLKSKKITPASGFSYKKFLISFQFIISISLLIGTIVVLRQVSFMQRQNTGANTEQTVILYKPSLTDSTWIQKLGNFKSNLKQYPFVENVCLSRYVPGESLDYTQDFIKKSNNPTNSSGLLYNNFTDADFMKLYGLKLLAGRPFIQGNKNLDIIISRRALKSLGFSRPEEALNQKIFNVGWKYEHTIVGVLEDFHQRSPKENFYPMAFMHIENPGISNKFSIRVRTTNMKEAITTIEKTWNAIFPGNGFEYFFLDDQYNNQYKADIQFGRIFLLFSILAIVIACVGLFALTLYSILVRAKEIAIRKVIGASLLQLFNTLTKDYFLLALTATLFALPLMYWVMSKWLENYASRIHFEWWFFVSPVIILVTVILLSVIFQVMGAMKANPIKNLRSE